jgi:hypothetical protein
VTESAFELACAMEGRFAVERELGSGAMGDVCLVHDRRCQVRLVLKCLKSTAEPTVGGPVRHPRRQSRSQ